MIVTLEKNILITVTKFKHCLIILLVALVILAILRLAIYLYENVQFASYVSRAKLILKANSKYFLYSMFIF